MRSNAALFALILVACSSSDDGGPPPCSGPTCPGAPGAPTFAGVASVAPDAQGTTLRVTWSPASDDSAAKEAIAYKVYVSTHPGEGVKKAAVVVTAPGAAEAFVKVSPAGARHYVVVRAVDPEGHEDGNVVEKSALAVPDTAAPSFGGIKSATPNAEGGVSVKWDAATDDLTPPEGLRYAVYGGVTAIDYGKPLTVVSAATEVSLANLGPPGQVQRFAVRAIDAAGNREGNLVTTEGTLGADKTAPTFAGCDGITARGSKGVVVTWTAAKDNATPAEAIVYDVYAATTAGGQDFGKDPVASVTGKTSLAIDAVQPGATYHVVCRARDAAGNRDANTVDKSATVSSDVTPPTFAGLDEPATIFDAQTRQVTLSWAAATDETTTQDKIVYDVFETTKLGTFDFAKPRITSGPGATQIVLTGLASASELRWVVRARDEALNNDANVVEAARTTAVSFSLDIEPLFTKNCAVVGCHTSAFAIGGLSLSQAVAYGTLVNVNANQRPPGFPTPMKRIAPGDPDNSYLYRKIIGTPGTFVGAQMPAPGTGNTLSDRDKAIVAAWITEGAARN